MKTKNTFCKRKKGFSLIELVVVIAILAILAALIVPVLINYVENSRAQKDYSAMDEVVNAVQLAMADPDCFDEMFTYSCDNNFITYSDSSGKYGQQVIDAEYWAPDGCGKATTITFNPEKDASGNTVYRLENAIVNDMTYGNGSIGDNRVMEGEQVSNSQCFFKNASINGSQTGYTYNRVRQSIGDVIMPTSQTYSNSSFTIFIKFTQKSGVASADISGSFNGTNLDNDSQAAIGTGTTDYDDDTNDPIVTKPNPGTQPPNSNSSSLSGSGQFTGTPEYKTEDETTGGICAILYDSNTLVFQATTLCNSKYGSIKATYMGSNGWLDTVYAELETVPWYEERENIQKVVVDCNIKPVGMKLWFYGFKNCTEMDLKKIDTSLVNSLYATFYECSSLVNVDVSHFNTANVTSMNRTFFNCSSLTSLDISNWNTSRVTTMEKTFNQCSSLTSLDISKWDTSKVTNMDHMFADCSNITTLDVSKWNVGQVSNMKYLFGNCKKLTTLDVSKWDTKNVSNLYGTFYYCQKLSVIDVSNWNTANVTNLGYTFIACNAVKNLDVSKWNTSNVTLMNQTFNYMANVEALDVSNWDTSKVTNMSKLFFCCYKITSLDLTKWNTDNVTSMSFMFGDCGSLTYLDLRSWSTSKVTTFGSMFDGCSKLTKIDGIETFDTANSIDFARMFARCKSIKELDISTFDTRKATAGVKITSMHTSNSMFDMFAEMNKLTTITFGENFRFDGDGTCPESAASLPTFISEYWYNVETGESYEATNMPNGAGTYTPTP